MERIAAHATRYKNVRFRSRLEARWAAFFDRLKWDWQYEPIDFERWVPDFQLELKPFHTRMYAEVKPYQQLSQFDKHPVLSQPFMFGLDGGLALGLNPSVSLVNPTVVAGPRNVGGIDFFALFSTIEANHILDHWSAAGNTVQWIPK